MTTYIDTEDTWLDSGSATCDIPGCSQPAAIIADTWNRERFCLNHTLQAADVPAHDHRFRGWYRIADSREHQLGLILTVHRL
ncbi:MAG: hypothetical protein JO259_07580 [Mycobacterium sp.]|nr:hypothetical protein [Mycobacterium sp.]